MELFMESWEGYASADDIFGRWHGRSGGGIRTVNGRKWWGLGVGGGSDLIFRSVDPTPGNQILIGFRVIFLQKPEPIFLMLRNGNSRMLQLSYDNAAARVRVQRGSTVLFEAPQQVPALTETYIELRAVLDNAAGSVELRINGVAAGSFQGNTINAGSILDNICFDGEGGIDDGPYITDVVMKDYGPFLGDVTVKRILLAGNGSQNDWTPSSGANYEAVNDPVRDDNSYVSTSTPGAKDFYALAEPDVPAGAVIHFVQVSGRARKEDAGDRGIKLLARSGTQVAESDPIVLSTGYSYFHRSFETNPETGQPWTAATLAAMQPGVECV